MDTYKLLDFDCKGNVVRFYLGRPDCVDYWGDDWNDSPYEHNAGCVYSSYVVGCVDIAFKYDVIVVEPCDGCVNSSWSKEDMQAQRVPMLCILHDTSDNGYSSWRYEYFDSVLANSDAIRVYMDSLVTESELHDLFDDIAHVWDIRLGSFGE